MDLIERAAQRIQQRTAQAHDAGPPVSPATTDRDRRSIADTPPRRDQNGDRAILDFALLKANGILTPERNRDQMIEEFRHIKRRIISSQFDESQPHRNVIMVTSALPGEGKTHVSINLAVSLALEHDWTALLIDADVITPQVYRRLGLRRDIGLMDMLSDPTIGVQDIMCRTNIDKLSLIHAGGGHSSTTELLSSQRMRAFVDDISARYADRIIIIDTPPLLATTEPAVIARHVGQILMVVEAERTRNSAIEAAANLLDHNDKLRIVLNKVRPQFGDSAFGPYYAYSQYGAYGSNGAGNNAANGHDSRAEPSPKRRVPWRRASRN